MQNINEVLSDKHNHLNELMHHTRALQKLHKKLCSLLPDFLVDQCSVASWEGDTVTLHANNGAAGTVLRYHLLRILPLLQRESGYHKIKHLICHIRPTASPTTQYDQALGKPHHSDKAAALLQEMAVNIQDSSIQAALLRLAQHVQIKKGK